jgi:Protein of unknown function (DUF4019)
MKLRIVGLLVAFALSSAAIGAAADEADKAAQAAAGKWLSLVDAGSYGESYEAAASMFRKALTKEQWVDAVGKARGPLGKLESRSLLGAKLMTELPNAPKGEYDVIQYEAKFSGGTAVETITPMKDTDGTWRVSGYYVRPGK